ncbi:MAG TPA: TMEM165/GDT1 family protein [Gemmatimonadales bacterium]|jgi:putative Ca2+/H+ antiporter (TMEM165/GDT1 family)|nr:TMEM165/GDT1 family protein [Gemmatimonadales bacterium]
MFAILLATYGAVFVAEIVGDKLLYTTGVLATRYRSLPIMLGMALAFTGKMGIAVLVGNAIAHLPRLVVAAVTTLSFLGVAYTLWRKPDVRDPARDARKQAPKGEGPKAVLVSFATIFFSEWGDVGQITAAAMAAKFNAPLVVWIGAVAAMVTKGVLAATLGAGVRQWIANRVSPRVVRYLAVAALLVLGLLSVLESLGVLES